MFSKFPKGLIYDEETLEHPPMISIYPKGEGTLPHAFSWLSRNGLDHCMRMLWSWAPLKNIARVDVYGGENNALRGMHIYYENGAQRTVGECRVGLEPYRSWTKPTAMYWSQPGESPWVQVVFDDDPTEKDSEKEWNRADLVGEVHLWLRQDRQCFKVMPAGSWLQG